MYAFNASSMACAYMQRASSLTAVFMGSSMCGQMLVCLASHTMMSCSIAWPVLRFPSEVAGHYDFVVCCHKAIDQGEDAKSLSPVIDDATTVVLLQNGVGNEDPFRDVYPKITILSGCVR